MRVALSMTGTTDPCVRGGSRDVQDYSVEISEPDMTLSVSPSTLSFLSGGETKTLSVSSNTSWTASSSQPWLSLAPMSGNNNGSIFVTAPPNTGANSRSATITVSGTGALPQTITVTQAGATPSFSASPTALSFDSGGESKTVTVTSNTSWTVASYASWLSVTPVSGSGNQTFSVTAQANIGSIARNAAITVSGSGGASPEHIRNPNRTNRFFGRTTGFPALRRRRRSANGAHHRQCHLDGKHSGALAHAG
ncbi:MAG: BACON domain-containing protein [Haliscomenobacter sp.]|nr:BACON domain-containing protein [Haliscomenobacter sp.]